MKEGLEKLGFRDEEDDGKYRIRLNEDFSLIYFCENKSFLLQCADVCYSVALKNFSTSEEVKEFIQHF